MLIKPLVIAISVSSVLMLSTAEARALRAPVITDSNSVEAKGDIPTPAKYENAIKNYMSDVVARLSGLDQNLQAIDVAVKSKDLAKAQQEYIKAHEAYESVRPVIVLFGNVDKGTNSRASYYVNGAKDPNFVGFHLVEYHLFETKNLQKAQDSNADLMNEVHDLKKRVAIETIPIGKMVQSSADLMESILSVKLAGEENIYSQSDIADMAGAVSGSQLIVHHLEPFIKKDVLSNIQQGYYDIDAVLAKYRESDGQYKAFSLLNETDKGALYSLVSQQAERLVDLRALLAIDVYYKYN